MPLLMEQERLIANESSLLYDSTVHAFPTTYGTINDYGNITLAADGIIAILLTLSGSGGTSGTHHIRLKIGSYYVLAEYSSIGVLTGTYGTLVYLAAGTYGVLAEGVRPNSDTQNIASLQIGIVSFNDVQGSALGAYSSGIALTVASRKTPLGSLSQATYCVQIYASTPSTQTRLEDVGESLTNGVSISVDSVQQNWSEKVTPDDAAYHGVSGKTYLPFSVGSSHTVSLSKRNANTAIHINVIACPWILPSSIGDPVVEDFSLGSTIYATFNALFQDVTKTVSIGAVRGVDFGSSFDYYSTSSGIGLLAYSYVWETPDINQVSLYVVGMGGCIEILGGDIR
jgi:hypothetical protein